MPKKTARIESMHRSNAGRKRRRLRYQVLESRRVLAAPVAGDDLFTITVDQPETVDYLLLNDRDADNDALVISSTTAPANGTLTPLGGDAFTYMPNLGFVGRDSFTYVVSDGSQSDVGTVHISVNESIDATAARNEILAGVSVLSNPGGPGNVLAYGPEAHVIANYLGTTDPMIVASAMGAGRVIALPDHQWLRMGTYGDSNDTGAFYRNSIAWLAESTSLSANIVVLEAATQTWLQGEGYTNVSLTTKANLPTTLPGADVFVAGWLGTSITTAQRDAITDFVHAGGGLAIAEYGNGFDEGIGWWNPSIKDAPGNQVLRDAGIAFTLGSRSGSSFDVSDQPTSQVNAASAIAALQNSTTFTDVELEAIGGIIANIDTSLPTTDTLIHRIDQQFDTRIATINPTPSSPVSDTFEKSLLDREGRLLLADPLTELAPHRVALPVSASAPRLSNSNVALPSPQVNHANLTIDTGLYAAPGELVTVDLPPALVGIGLEIRVGHLRTDLNDNEFKIAPHQQYDFDVDAAQIQVGSPHGGLIMFVAKSGVEWASAQSVMISGAVAAPYFVLGQDTNAGWAAGNRDRGTPFGVLQSDNNVLIVHADTYLRDLDDPAEVTGYYDDLIGILSDFYAYDRGRPLRIHHDYQPVGGFSSYPQSYKIESNTVDYETLITHGPALTTHEFGHIADSSKIIFEQFGETSPNIGGKYAQAVYNNVAWKQELAVGRINNYLFSLDDDLYNHANHYRVDVKGTFVDSFGEVFGWDSVRSIVHAITGLSAAETDTNQKKENQWLIQTSLEVGFDVSSFLQQWQLDFTQDALDAVAHLPKWNMIELVPEDLVVKQDTTITITDPSANDFSYDGSLSLTGVSSPQFGTLAYRGDGTYSYAPNQGFTGDDFFEYTVVNATGNQFVGRVDVTVLAPAEFPTVDSGNIEADTTNWTTVSLDETFDSMVVIAQVVQQDGDPPLVTRIRNASANSFEIMLQRADGQTGVIDEVQVQYLVVEEGVYDEDTHGYKFEAAKTMSQVTDSAGDFVGQEITLAHRLADHYYKAAIFGQVMSYNDTDWSTFWADGGETGYSIGKHVGEDTDTTRVDEVLGYVVLESGSLQIGDVRLQAGSLGTDGYEGFNKATSSGFAHTFDKQPPLTGALVQGSEISTSEDGYWVVLTGVDGVPNRVGAMVVEDTIGDAEQDHDDVKGSYILFSELRDRAFANDDDATLFGPSISIDPLANDISPSGAKLDVLSWSIPANGSVVDQGDGRLLYTPGNGFTGNDSFQYTVTDGSTTDVGVIRISQLAFPVAHWKLDEASGTTATDSTGNGNDGALSGGVTLGQAGAVDDAFVFDGATGRIEVGKPLLGDGQALTIAAWVKTTFSGDSQVIYSRGGSSKGYQLAIDASGQANFVYRRGSGNVVIATGTEAINDGQWHFVVGSADPGSSLTSLYVDGVKVDSTSYNPMAGNPGQTAQIGRQSGTVVLHDGPMNGSLDDIRVFDQALSETTVRDWYASNFGAPTIESIVINNGEEQRSQINSLTVTFDGLVNVPDSAFLLEDLGTSASPERIAVSGLVVNSVPVAGQTVTTITFADSPQTELQSNGFTLADGNYRLRVIGEQITKPGSGVAIASDETFGNASDEFFRLYGDGNGDGRVNINDFVSDFLPAFESTDASPGFRHDLDGNADGRVNINDFVSSFLPNFGKLR